MRILLIGLIMLVFSCRKDDDKNSNGRLLNRAPQDFVIVPESITGNSITASYSQSFDPDYNELTYNIYLSDSLIAEGITYTGSVKFSNLQAAKSYKITITASDKSGSKNVQVQSIKTLAYGASVARITQYFNGKQREYGIFYPSGYHENLPVVIFLHGASGIVWPEMISYYFTQLAEREKFIFIQPQALYNNNSTDRMTAWDAHNTQPWNDLAFIGCIIDTLMKQGNIDTKRIYVSGMSNGGFMTYSVAERFQDKIAAIAPIAGLMDKTVFNNYDMRKPMPLCYMHGTADKTVKIEGDAYSVGWDQILAYWIENNAVSNNPVITELANINTSDNSTVTKFEYSSYSGKGDIVFYRINNGVHSIPGLEYPGNRDINAFEEIWGFLKKHSLYE